MADRPKTDLVLVGTLTGVEPRGDWWSFSITEDGKQYPKKVDTKKTEIQQAAVAMLNQRVKAMVTEQDSEKINEHTGKPFVNRYLNQIALAAPDDVSSQQPSQATPAAQGNAGSGQAQGPSETVRELRIMRMGASERAVAMLGTGLLGVNPTINDLVETAEAWVAYYVYGAARFGVPSFDSGIAHGEGSGPSENESHHGEQTTLGDGHEPPPHGDEDVPF